MLWIYEKILYYTWFREFRIIKTKDFPSVCHVFPILTYFISSVFHFFHYFTVIFIKEMKWMYKYVINNTMFLPPTQTSESAAFPMLSKKLLSRKLFDYSQRPKTHVSSLNNCERFEFVDCFDQIRFICNNCVDIFVCSRCF